MPDNSRPGGKQPPPIIPDSAAIVNPPPVRIASSAASTQQGQGTSTARPFGTPKDMVTSIGTDLSSIWAKSQKLTEWHNEQLRTANNNLAKLTEELRFMTIERDKLREALVNANALSESRGNELLGTRAFLTKADAISESEVVALAETVNNETYQAAASLCDSFVPVRYAHTDLGLQQFRTRVQSIIGNELTQLVESVPDKSTVNPFFVQIVLQTLFCRHLANVIETWHNENDPHAEKLLVRLYDDLRRTENQAVSGRWRALTRACLRPNIDEWTQQFRNHLRAINYLAGWSLADPMLETTLADKLRPVFKAAEKLRRAMGEQVTSADIEIAIPRQRARFSAHKMADDWGGARDTNSSAQDAVAGTTGIGLKRRVTHGGSDESTKYEIILLPKVVLVSSLQEIVGPPLHAKRK